MTLGDASSAVCVLGPVEVAGAGQVLRVTPLQRSLIAVLASHYGQTVSTDRLVDALWTGPGPSSARNRVQSVVSSLRKLSAADPALDDLIVTGREGYSLGINPNRLDVACFERLVGDGRRCAATGDLAAAVRSLREALALWRGPAFEGVDSVYVRAEAARLEELRHAATEDMVDASLALGAGSALVAELAGLVAAAPYRVRLRGQFMIALHRSGRQAEALEVYRAGAQILADEHGLDPGIELQRLRDAILLDQPVGPEWTVAADAPAQLAPPRRPIPAQLPAPAPGFAGRAADLTRLDGLLAIPEGSTPVTIVIISGTAGVGKTALAVHWAHRVADRFPDGQLYVNLQGFGPSGSATSSAVALRGFLDALDVAPQRIPVELSDRVGLYRSLLAGRRVLVVLDNARDAEQVRPLLPGSPGCLVVVSSREQLGGLVAVEGAHPVALNPLSRADAREMLAYRLGASRLVAEPVAVEALITRSARLPLAMAIVAARAVIHPTAPLGEFVDQMQSASSELDHLDGGDASSNLRAVLSWSLNALSGEAARLLALSGLHPGPELSADAVASLAGMTGAYARSTVGELARCHLVDELGAGRYGYHDLLRAYARELSSTRLATAERESALHRLMDHYLHTAYTAARLLAPHRDPITLPPPVTGATPSELISREDAVRWFTTEYRTLLAMIDLAAEAAGFDGYAWRLVWTMLDFFDWRCHWHDWAQAQRTALRATSRSADRGARAHIHRGLGRAYERLGSFGEADAEFAAALECFADVGDSSGQAHIHLDLGWLCDRQRRYVEAARHAQRALDLFRALGNRDKEAHSLAAVGWYQARQGDYAGSLAHLVEALALHQRNGDMHGEASASESLGYAYHHLGRYPEAVRSYTHAHERCQSVGDRFGETVILDRLGDVHRDAGARDAARDVWTRAADLLDELGHEGSDRIRAKLKEMR